MDGDVGITFILAIMEISDEIWCQLINQLFTVELRTRKSMDTDFYQRRFDRIRDLLKEIQIYVHDPLGENYDHTRTDCEAILQGEPQSPLTIVEVIKPIIYFTNGETRRLIQPGVVMIQSATL